MDNRVTIRWWGSFACFTPPALKTERFSYPFPTPSAIRGATQCVCWKPEMYYWVDSLVVLKAGHRVSVTTNGMKATVREGRIPRTEPINLAEGAFRSQRGALILADVEYLATVEVRVPGDDRDMIVKYAEMLRRRVRKGQFVRRPYFGCREYAANFELVEDPTLFKGDGSLVPDSGGTMIYDPYNPFDLAKQPFNTPCNPTYFCPKVEPGNRIDMHPERVTLFPRKENI